MSQRTKFGVMMLMYLFLNSVFFGTLFAQKHILIGLIAVLGAQVIAWLAIVMIIESEIKKRPK